MLEHLTTGQFFALPVILFSLVALALAHHGRRVMKWVKWAVVTVVEDHERRFR